MLWRGRAAHKVAQAVRPLTKERKVGRREGVAGCGGRTDATAAAPVRDRARVGMHKASAQCVDSGLIRRERSCTARVRRRGRWFFFDGSAAGG